MRSPLKIILADDDKDDCFLFNEAVEELAIPVDLFIVHDGSQLMQNLKDESITIPDGLFLDLNMPKKNGVECLSEIKNHAKLQHLPIIIFSTGFESGIAQELHEMGANYYIRKPSDFLRLKNLINEALALITVPLAAQTPQKDFVLTL
ncbi:MAG: response regulator [Balneolaceae bacterium]